MRSLIYRFQSFLARKENLRAHFWQSVANYIQQGFGLGFGVILARLLTPEDFGHYGLVFATIGLCLLPANWTLGQAVVADAGRTPGLFDRAVAFTWAMTLIRLTISVGVVIWGLLHKDLLFAQLAAIVGFSESVRELNYMRKFWLEGSGNFKPNAVSAVLNSSSAMILAISMAIWGAGPFAIAVPGISNAVLDCLIFGRASRKSIWVKPSIKAGHGQFTVGFWLWLSNLAEIGIQRFDKWFIGTYSTPEVLGNYNRAYGYSPLSHLFLNSFMSSPTVVAFTRAATARERQRILLRTGLILLAGSTVNWVVLAFFAHQFVGLLFGPKWLEAVPYFQAFAPLSACMAFHYLPLTLLLSHREYAFIAIIRTIGFGILVAGLFALRGSVTPVIVAWAVQGVVVAQGIFYWIRATKLIRG